MELLSRNTHLSQFVVSDFDTLLVTARIQLRMHLQPFPGCRLTDKVAHHRPTLQRPPPPVPCQVGEHPVLDLVPLARPRREVAYRWADSQKVAVDSGSR